MNINDSPPTDALVSIAEAAKRVGVSRRTIERWVAKGALEATPDPSDRRRRLVNIAVVQDLVLATKNSQPAAPELPERELLPLPSERQNNKVDSALESQDYQEVTDNVLQLVYSHLHRLVTQLYPESFRPLTLDQLRSGPFGQDLLRLARFARGHSREDREHVLESIDSVVQLLFWPVAAEDYSVPRAFWDTDLGRMLALAKFRVYERSELMTIEDAARALGVSRPTVYSWMDDRSLSYVRDDLSGRTFVIRSDVEKLVEVAHEF